MTLGHGEPPGDRARDAPLPQLLEIFKRGMVAIVMHGNEFQGLITRIDLVNWLRAPRRCSVTKYVR